MSLIFIGIHIYGFTFHSLAVGMDRDSIKEFRSI